jgi:hypothetical protein
MAAASASVPSVEEHAEEAARKPNVYVVVAYRLGRLNDHNYIVTATADRAGAIAAAEEEHDGRGGKYGVEVVEFPAEETVAYFPSSGDAAEVKGPEQSDDLSAAHYIGNQILWAFQNHVRWAPSGETIDTPGGPVDTLKQVPAEFPPWIAELCQHSLDIHRRGK